MFNLQPFLEDLFRMATWSTERQLAAALSALILLHLLVRIGISLDSVTGVGFGALAALLAWTAGHVATRSAALIWRALELESKRWELRRKG